MRFQTGCRLRAFSGISNAMKCNWIAAAALVIVVQAAGAAGPESRQRFEKPEDVVAWLYRDFSWEILIDQWFQKDQLVEQPLSVLSRYFTPKLARLIVKDRQHVVKSKELGHLDFVLLFGSQDPDGISNIRIARVPNTNKVSVAYNQGGQRDQMRMVFDTVRTSGGWRISDIQYTMRATSGGSAMKFGLMEVLSQPY